MKFEKIDCGGGIAAIVSSDSQVIVDVDSALDLLMSAKYEAGTKYIAVDKKLIAEDFFVLSSGLAGEILQKYINYGGKIAIYGDFSHYTSKPLKDFIYESNKGKDVFFAATKEEAVQKLADVIQQTKSPIGLLCINPTPKRSCSFCMTAFFCPAHAG